MLFRRKHPPKWTERLRVMLWPRRSWVRSVKYLSKRVLRLTATPHAVSAGVAAGVFASFTPFLGFHFVIAFAVAYFIAGNFIAAASGTFFGNPLTFPFIWASTYNLGQFILSRQNPNSDSPQLDSLLDADVWEVGVFGIFELVGGLWQPVIQPMLIGSVPLGTLAGMIAYVVTRWMSVKFHEARRRRRRKRRTAGKIAVEELEKAE